MSKHSPKAVSQVYTDLYFPDIQWFSHNSQGLVLLHNTIVALLVLNYIITTGLIVLVYTLYDMCNLSNTFNDLFFNVLL